MSHLTTRPGTAEVELRTQELDVPCTTSTRVRDGTLGYDDRHEWRRRALQLLLTADFACFPRLVFALGGSSLLALGWREVRCSIAMLPVRSFPPPRRKVATYKGGQRGRQTNHRD